MNQDNSSILARAHTLAPEISRLRRDTHRYPELGFQEVRTAALVADTLTEIGATNIRTGVGITGVVAELGENEGPTIARMHAFAVDNGYKLAGKHHEIYLGDPRRVAPEKLKTVLRQPIRPGSQ